MIVDVVHIATIISIVLCLNLAVMMSLQGFRPRGSSVAPPPRQSESRAAGNSRGNGVSYGSGRQWGPSPDAPPADGRADGRARRLAGDTAQARQAIMDARRSFRTQEQQARAMVD